MAAILNYHRCHGKNCRGGHAQDTFTSKPEEQKKGWKKCDCFIVANGSLGKVAKRKTTKQRDWAQAEAVMAPFIEANSWEIEAVPVAPQPLAEPQAEGADVKKKGLMTDAVAAFLADHRKYDSAFGTIRNHEIRLDLALEFCQRKGIVQVDQWTRELVQEFLDMREVSLATRKDYQDKHAAFLNWCMGNGWRTERDNPAKFKVAIRNVATSRLKKNRQKYDFSNEELTRMFTAALEKYDLFCKSRSGEIVPTTACHARRFFGKDVADFMAVKLLTGMRISNVAKFHIRQLKDDNQVHIRTIKGDVPVYTAVPPELGDIMRERAKRFGPYIFGEHRTNQIGVVTACWRNRLNFLWELCGPWERKPTPHRLRHTFARIVLDAGKSAREVGILLGNTEAVVNEYYSAFGKARQEKLAEEMRGAFAGVPNHFTRTPGKVQPIRTKTA